MTKVPPPVDNANRQAGEAVADALPLPLITEEMMERGRAVYQAWADRFILFDFAVSDYAVDELLQAIFAEMTVANSRIASGIVAGWKRDL